MIIFPYKPSSKSAKALAEELGCKLMRAEGSKYKKKLVINWGSSKPPQGLAADVRVINKFDKVKLASNKLTTFQALGDIPHVPWTTDKEVATGWLQEGHTVFARTTLNGHSGQGIVVVNPHDPLPDATLYTQYVKKKHEYRIHATSETVLDYAEKRKRAGEEADAKIRSHLRGWVFCRQDVHLPEGVTEIAIRSIKTLGLDFGAVDIIYNAHYGKAYVLEINTAPGLEGITVKHYANYLRNSQ